MPLPTSGLISKCIGSMDSEARLSKMNLEEKFTKKRAARGPGETVDFYELIFDYVKNYNFPSEVRGRIDFSQLSVADVIEAKLKVYNTPVVYEMVSSNPYGDMNGLKMGSKKQKSNVVFSSVFTNNTSTAQTHHLSTERRTTATCSLVVTKGLTKEGELSLEIAPPNMIIQASGSFRKEVTMENEQEKTMEEEMSWTLDTEVIVPAGCKTRAELVISEEQYDGRFRIDTIIEGTISVITRDKRGNTVCPVVISDLVKVFTLKEGFYPVEGKKNAVRFVNEGSCSCQYGIAQRVDLHEEKL